MVNPHVTEPRETEISVRGAAIKSGSATVLTNSDIHAHNTFEQKQVVVPATKVLEIKGQALHHSFAPASVTKLSLTLS
jgi:alpha-L-arabinofuranosidase